MKTPATAPLPSHLELTARIAAGLASNPKVVTGFKAGSFSGTQADEIARVSAYWANLVIEASKEATAAP